MAVHCSSNVILLAIEYFLDSKGERQNIKLLSTQNNYSPSFGLKKLVIFFISSDKTDKKLCWSWKCKTRCRTKRRGGQGMAFDQGARRPQSTITAKSTGAPQNAWRLKLKKIQRIQRNIDGKKLVSSLFFILIIFLFSAKSGGGGAKKWWGRGPTSPSPSAVPVSKSPHAQRICLIYRFKFIGDVKVVLKSSEDPKMKTSLPTISKVNCS